MLELRGEPTAAPWEWEARLTSGVLLESGEEWEGLHVRYRRVGGWRWTRFNLIPDGDAFPTEAVVLEAIEVHERSIRGGSA